MGVTNRGSVGVRAEQIERGLVEEKKNKKQNVASSVFL